MSVELSRRRADSGPHPGGARWLAMLLLMLASLASAPPAHAQGSLITHLAGLAGSPGSADGTGSDARFRSPYGVAVDAAGTVYVADRDNQLIRKITRAGDVTTLAGLAGVSGSIDGTGSAARFSNPLGVAVDAAGTVYVADAGNHTIRKITPAGAVTTLAGLAGNLGSADGMGSAARFANPIGVAVDAAGMVYVADSLNQTIRKVTPAGEVTTLAGLAGVAGNEDGTGSAARFFNPRAVAVDAAGMVYVSANYTIRRVTPAAVVTTVAGLAGSPGSADGTGSAARFASSPGLGVDTAGTVYVADGSNHTIRRVTPAGAVTTLAGLAGSPGSVDGTGSAARFANPAGVAVDAAGTMSVADFSNHAIRRGDLPDGDPDGDGFTNEQELAAGTNPMVAQLYFAEGSLTSLGNGRFETRFSLFNPSPASDIDITLKFQPQGGAEIVDAFTLGAGARKTIDTSAEYPALNAYGGFSTVIEGRFTSLTAPVRRYNVVAERQMTWARGGAIDGYSSHSETAIRRPATTWYLAEGSTLGTFALYYLLQNPGADATTVTITYVFPSGPPCTVTRTVDALSRFTVYVNGDLATSCGVGKRDVSAAITAPTPIIVERAMYLDDGPGGRPFYYSGHESAGVLEPQANWLFAEGATGTYFDTYVLVFNQEPFPLDIRLTFLRQGLPDVSVERQIPANSRNTFALDVLRESGTGSGQAGNYVVPAEGGVSTVVDVLTPGGKVIAERAMWWPGPLSGATGPGNPQPLWEEAHVSAGATRTSTSWAIADAEAQGPNLAETYALLSNVSAVDTVARITVAFTDAGGTVTTHAFDQVIGAKRRFTLGFPSTRFGTAFDDPAVLKRFSVTIESLGLGGNPPGELVVERAHYSRDIPASTPGAMVPPWPYWPAGANNLATPLR